MEVKKSRLLLLADILNRETDEEHPITVTAIIDRLTAEGFNATRKTVFHDIAVLEEHGMDIICNKGRENQYLIGARTFELPELIMLVDAVQAARFIPVKRSQTLISKLSSLASVHQADCLCRELYTDRQVKSTNENVLYTVDMIYAAIHAGKKIAFQYFEYTAEKKKILKHGGRVYSFSPYALIWNNDSYYALGYSDSHGKVVKFRVDRMAKPKQTEHSAVSKPKDFRVEEYAKAVFAMYDEETCTVTLRCENSLMKSVVDRFGSQVKTAVTDDRHFTAEVEVSVSPTFFGWVVGFGGKMEITAPEDVANRYHDTLRLILEKARR